MSRDSPESAAALTLVESLLVTLETSGVLSAEDIDEVYETAIAAHRRADDPSADVRAAELLERIHTKGNSVRRKP